MESKEYHCVDCGKILIRKISTRSEFKCARCRELARTRKFKELGMCSLCGKVSTEEGKKRCKECREKQTAFKAKSRVALGEVRYVNINPIRKERAENNLCTKCGSYPPMEGKRRCQCCYDTQEAYRNKHKQKGLN